MVKLLELPAPLASYRSYGVFSDFAGLSPRQTHTYQVADLAAGADIAATVIFSPTRRVYVHSVVITPDGTAAGIDDSNTSVWLVTDGSNTMVSKTYNTTNTHPADNVQTSLGTIAYNVIEAGGRVELTLTNGAAANTVATVLTITYSDYEAFPNSDWSIVATDDGSASISDGVKGVCALTPSDGTAGDNDEIYLFSAKELFKNAVDKPIVAECQIQFTEANTDDANVAFGIKDAVAANTIVDDGAGMATSFEGACIYKVDGGTAWKCVTSKSTTQTVNTSTTTAGGSAYQKLRVEIIPQSNSIAFVHFFVDDMQLVDSTTLKTIEHQLDFSSSPTEMAVFVGIKNGGANAETLNVDYLGAFQNR